MKNILHKEYSDTNIKIDTWTISRLENRVRE